jgi:hypothetical protein
MIDGGKIKTDSATLKSGSYLCRETRIFDADARFAPAAFSSSSCSQHRHSTAPLYVNLAGRMTLCLDSGTRIERSAGNLVFSDERRTRGRNARTNSSAITHTCRWSSVARRRTWWVVPRMAPGLIECGLLLAVCGWSIIRSQSRSNSAHGRGASASRRNVV